MRNRNLLPSLAAVLALTLVAVAGCQAVPSGTADLAPAAEPAPAATGAPAGAGEACVAVDRSRPLPYVIVDSPWGGWATVGVCPAVADTGPTPVRFWLPAAVDEAAARAALTYTGPGQPDVTYTHLRDQALLTVLLPPAEPGDAGTVRLDGIPGPDGAPVTLRFSVARHPVPTLQAERLAEDGSWQPLAAGATLPRRPITLRLRFPGAWAPLERIKQQAEQAGIQVAAPDAETVLLTVTDPPPRLHFDLTTRVYLGSAGWRTWTIWFGVDFGTPPALVALDPATGAEDRIAEAPVDLLASSLSPDGRWALLEAVDPFRPLEAQVWVVDIAAGQRYLTPLRTGIWPYPVAWQPDRVVVPRGNMVQTWYLQEARAEVQVYPAGWWLTHSPDARWLAGFSYAGRSDEYSPVTVVLYDAATGTGRVHRDLVERFVTGTHRPSSPPFRWSDDGHLLVEEHGDWDSQTWRPVSSHWLVLDPAAGSVTPYAGATPPPPRWDGSPPPAWHPGPGGWQVWREEGWGPVRLRGPDCAEVEHGSGHVLDWAPDGRLLVVRWAHYPDRRFRLSGW